MVFTRSAAKQPTTPSRAAGPARKGKKQTAPPPQPEARPAKRTSARVAGRSQDETEHLAAVLAPVPLSAVRSVTRSRLVSSANAGSNGSPSPSIRSPHFKRALNVKEVAFGPYRRRYNLRGCPVLGDLPAYLSRLTVFKTGTNGGQLTPVPIQHVACMKDRLLPPLASLFGLIPRDFADEGTKVEIPLGSTWTECMDFCRQEGEADRRSEKCGGIPGLFYS